MAYWGKPNGVKFIVRHFLFWSWILTNKDKNNIDRTPGQDAFDEMSEVIRSLLNENDRNKGLTFIISWSFLAL